MKQKRLLPMLSLFAFIAFTACEKNEDDKKENSVNQSPIEGKWKVTAVTYTISSGGVDSTSDGYYQIDTCRRDDLIWFTSGNTVIRVTGAIKCSPFESDHENSGIWALSNNNKTLTIDDRDGGIDVSDILTLNASTLELQYKSEKNGTTAKLVIVHTRQP